ncbi:MAG: KUP/HAK/KT family potassium transporter [Opitutaceae bacterium]
MSQPTNSSAATPARLGLIVGALGVVFGDIGTSPLYTFRECLAALPADQRTAGILGVLSLVFWALFLVVTIKYVWFITRSDNHGEGGIFALLALSGEKPGAGKVTAWIFLLLIGAALLYGDGVITPAVSVLGAVEGLVTVNPGLHHVVVPLSVVVLFLLFLLQRVGTASIGKVFGPLMLLWFGTLAALGIWHIAGNLAVLAALNPLHAIRLLTSGNVHIATMLGAVVLAFTGAEALYADLGHFGRKAIATGWYTVAMPALVLSYFGQGAWALAHPGDGTNPFFALAPEGWPRLALTGISVAAAVIASQALISGTFSLTRQAIQLGFLPRLTVRHTSAALEGQIYLPLVNVTLAVATIWVTVAFGSSTSLASAYGIAVTGTMVVTTIAYFAVLRRKRWPLWRALPLCTLFLVVDASLFAANLGKIKDGGWLPLLIGAGVLAIMHTWRTGKGEVVRRVYSNEITEDELRTMARSRNVSRVRGGAVFMAGNPRGTPLVLVHHLKASRSLHEHVAILSVLTETVPYVADADRLTLSEIGEGCWRVVGRYGYMESPDASALLEAARAHGLPLRPDTATYYFNHEMVVTGGSSPMPVWQKQLYGLLSRNARPARDYFRIPPSQIVELGLPIQL